MALTSSEVRQKAKSFASGLEGLTAKQKGMAPTPEFAEQYNTLLEQAKEAAPNVKPEMWPPPIAIVDAGMGVTQVRALFPEVAAYLNLILSHFPAAMGVVRGR